MGTGKLVLMMVLFSAAGFAATGDYVKTLNFSRNCGSGVGVGIAYDGENLWYSCYGSSPDLYRADPQTGEVTASYNIAGGLGALAYDATRNAIWAGWGRLWSPDGEVFLIQLDASKNVNGSKVAFKANEAYSFVLDDGLAFDAEEGVLYVSEDGSEFIYKYLTNGTFLGSFRWAGNGCYNSGLAIGGDLLYQGSDGCNRVWVVDKHDPAAIAFDFSTTQAGDAAFRDEDLECDTNTFSSEGMHVVWSIEAYDPNEPRGLGTGPRRAIAFEIPFGSCGFGGMPAGMPGRMTGGGSIVNDGLKVTHGFELNCDAAKGPNNLEVNWGKNNRFHLDSLTNAYCINKASGQPKAGFDTYVGGGVGTYNGASGFTAEWTFTDAGEPGKGDNAKIVVRDRSRNAILSVSGNLGSGNHQAHRP